MEVFMHLPKKAKERQQNSFMTVTCDICGVTSDLDETFTQSRKSFRRKEITYCPACWAKRQISSLKSFYWIWGIFVLIAVIKVAFDPKEGWLFLNLFFSGLCILLMIIPHELGHAIMAAWLGRRVFDIVIGSGQIIKKVMIFGFLFEIRQFPFHGLTLSLALSPRWYRLKQFLIVLAGPAVNLSLLVLVLPFFDSKRLNPSFATALSPVGWLILANAWILLLNLFPHHLKLSDRKIANDGLSLLTVPFLSKTKIEEILPLYFIFEGSEFLKRGQFEDAQACYRNGLMNHPDHFSIKNGLGVALLELGEAKEARIIFTQLLEKEESNKLLHATVLNNLAYANILYDRQGLLEEADALSAQVYRSFPWVPTFKGTRGVVLTEMGKFDEGINLLKQSMEENESPRHKATEAAHIAIAEMKRGNHECAQQYLDAALQFDVNCFLIERVRNELLTAQELQPISKAFS